MVFWRRVGRIGSGFMFDAGGGLTAGAYARWNAVASRLAGKGGEHCQVCSSEVRHRALLRWMLSGHAWIPDTALCLLQADYLPAHKMDIGAMR